jgi:hypothetical protein
MIYINASALAFFCSPKNKYIIDGGDMSTDWDKIARQTKWKNRGMNIGFALIVAGTMVQVYSLI